MIGSIDTSEFVVAVAASLGFLFSLGSQGLKWTWVLAFLLGGLIAAPVAAWLVRMVPPRVLGSAVGGVIIVTDVQTLLKSDWIAAPGAVSAVVYIALYAVWAAALAYSVRAHLKERAAQTESAEERQPVSVSL
ncbi:hypothetical protein SALBM311S_01734 [Streptomyces alboniger]